MPFSFQYYKYCDEEDSVQCLLCPRQCNFEKKSQKGFCRAVIRDEKELIPHRQNYHTAFAIDPIEKKPLFHFHPGEVVLSIGRNFCNLVCSFCQNYHISQQPASHSEKTDEKVLVQTLKEKNINMVAFTYDEPLVAYESYTHFAKLLKAIGFHTIAVTNATISSQYFKQLTSFTDAFNIDLKGPSNNFYEKYCGVAAFDNVMRNIEIAHKNSHCEVTYLLITNANDDAEEFECLMQNLFTKTSKSLPLHISAYKPMYKMDNPPTSLEKLIEFYQIAKKYFDYVYLGNVANRKFTSSFCPECSSVIIDRNGYEVYNLMDENKKCTNCMHQLNNDFIF